MKIKPADRKALADRCEIEDAYLYQLLTRRRLASAVLCVTIERESGGAITRRDLRPDDWAQIWPELDTAPVSAIQQGA